MEKYVIVKTEQTGTPETSTVVDSRYFDTFQEAKDEIGTRFLTAKAEGKPFNQSISTRIL